MAVFEYEFMQRAFWAGGLIGVIAPILGVYLMLRRQVLMADTLSHVSLAGVALGSVMNLNPVICGFAVALIGALLVEQLRRSYRTYSEVPVAIIMTSGLALAVVLMSLQTNLSKAFSSYLFGSIVAVSDIQLWMMASVCVFGLLFFILLRRPLYSFTFDEETASIGGVQVKGLSFAFAILTGMTVASAMPIVGVLLVSALIVLPASLALRVSRSFTAAIIVAVITGLIGIFSGLTTSYHLNTPPGGTIALILLVFLLTGISAQKLIARYNRKRHRTETKSQHVIRVNHSRRKTSHEIQ